MPRRSQRLLTPAKTHQPAEEEESPTSQEIVLHSGDDVGLVYMKHGCLPICESAAEEYIRNCEKYSVNIDPGVVISLRTGYVHSLFYNYFHYESHPHVGRRWHVMHPTKLFAEGAMLPLLGVLDGNAHIQSLNLSDASMQDSRFRGRYTPTNTNHTSTKATQTLVLIFILLLLLVQHVIGLLIVDDCDVYCSVVLLRCD
jgi:hypothetical protein